MKNKRKIPCFASIAQVRDERTGYEFDLYLLSETRISKQDLLQDCHDDSYKVFAVSTPARAKITVNLEGISFEEVRV